MKYIMKCVFVNLGKHFGGAENYLITVISRWVEDGDEAIVIAKKGTPFAETIKTKILNVRLKEVDYSIGNIKQVKELLKQDSVDIINVDGINSGLFMLLASNGLPKVTTVHSNAEMDRTEKPWIARKIFVLAENICLKKSDRIIAVSEAISELLKSRRIDANKIMVVHNGVKFINYPEKNFNTNISNPLRICFAGRLEKVKGCDILIKALGSISNVNFLCDIYGDGSERNNLEQLVIDNKLSNKVKFQGFSNHIRELLPSYDVLVLPSLFEAFPLTIPEAMNAKTLIVCSKVGGMPYIIDDSKTGFLFEKGNDKQLAEFIQKIEANRDILKNVSCRAYDEFIQMYTEEIMTRRTFEIFKNTVR